MTDSRPNADLQRQRRRTWIVGTFLTILHVLLVVSVSRHAAIVWFELPALAIVAWLAVRGWLSPSLPLAFSSVCAFLLGEPSVGFYPATWFMVLPLLFLIQREPRLRFLIGWGLWTGVLIATGIYAWLMPAMVVFYEFSPAAALPLFLLTTTLIGIQLAAFLPLTRWLHERLKWPLAFVAAGLYTVIEYWIPLPTPIAISLGFVRAPFFLQPADLLGLHGVSFLAVAASAGIFHAIQSIRARDRSGRNTGLIVASAVLLLHAGYCLWAFHHYRDDPSLPSIDVAMIQPMAPLKVHNTDAALQAEVAKTLISLSLDAIRSREGTPDLLIWPEGAAPFAARSPRFNPAYFQALVAVQRETSTTLLVHNIEFTRDPDTEAVRYSSAISLVKPIGRVVDSYRKTILMPFSEYLPFESVLPVLRKWLPQARSILPGEEPRLLEGPGGPMAPLICYEVLFPGYVRSLVNQGATYIVNLTNDRWYGPRQQPWQHLGFAVVRAVENRKPVARSTNSGISALIDARGVIASGRRTAILEKTALRGTLTPRPGQTLYGRHADILHRWVLTPFWLVMLIYVYSPFRPGSIRAPRKPSRDACTPKPLDS